MNKTTEEIYNGVWKDIVEKDGVLDIEQVKKELYDYWYILTQVPKVYSAVTGGKLSKPNYESGVVITGFEDYLNQCIEEEIQDRKEDEHAHSKP